MTTLNLRAFGIFTDTSIQFPNETNLQIVYGPNEAGKTTAMRAVFAALFGFPHLSQDNFLHSKPIVGAAIQSDGKRISFHRRKGRRNTLLHPQSNAALPEDALHPFLHGIDAETFARVYSLDLAELERGGEELRKLRGLVGESLFAASLGGAGLTNTLNQLDAEAKEIFAKNKRKHAVGVLKNEFEQAIKEKKHATFPFVKWQQLQQELHDARNTKDLIVKELNELRLHEKRLSRIRQSLGLLHQRADLLDEIESYRDAKILPDTYSSQERSRIEGEILQLESYAHTLASELAGPSGLMAQTEDIDFSAELLDFEQDINDLQQRLGACEKAKRDRDLRLIAQRDQFTATVQQIIADLNLDLEYDEIDQLRVTPETKVEIQTLGSEQKSLQEKPQDIKLQQRTLQSKLDRLSDQLRQLGIPMDGSNLRKLSQEIRKHGSLESRLRQLQDQSRKLKSKAGRQLASIGLWPGKLEEIANVHLPMNETIARFCDQHRELENTKKQFERRQQQLTDEIHEIAEKVERLTGTTNVLTEHDLEQKRAERDSMWALFRERPWQRFASEKTNPFKMEEFEKLVAQADEISDRLRREASRVEKLAQWNATKRKLATQNEQCRQQIQDHVSQLSTLNKNWIDLWSSMGIEKPLPPNEMQVWAGHFAASQQEYFAAVEFDSEAHRLDAQIQACRDQLLSAGKAVSVQLHSTDSLDSLLDEIDNLIHLQDETANRVHQLDATLLATQRDLALLQPQLAAAVERLQIWNQRWHQMMSEIGCDPQTSAAQANERINQLDRLFDTVQQRHDIDVRIECIDRELREFESEVTRLAKKTGIAIPNSAFEAAKELRRQLHNSQKQSDKRSALLDAIEKNKKRQDQTAATRLRLRSKLAVLCQTAGVDSSEQLPEIESRSQAFVKCRDRLQTIEGQLLELGCGLTIDDLARDGEGQQGDQIELELENLNKQIKQKEHARDEIAARVHELETQHAHIDQTAVSAAADQRSLGILSRMHDLSAQYIQLKVAYSLLRQQIEKYRSENEDPLLAIASDYFARMTCHEFIGLQNSYADDEAIIVGLRQNHELVSVEQMSTGTRDQLYLSLRLGYLHQRLVDHEPMPLIVDDILVNFDDRRARATLDVLANIGQQCQIILFTHHHRIVEMGQQLNGSASLISLESERTESAAHSR